MFSSLAARPGVRCGAMNTLRLLFGLSATVTRKAYVIAGILLMALKIALDNGLAYATTGRTWSPAAYFAPSYFLKAQDLKAAQSEEALALLVLVALPFVWIGVSMSVRRAADAGLSPFVGLLFLVPVINWIAMLVFAALPSAKEGSRWVPPAPYRQMPQTPAPPPELDPGLRATLLGMLSSVALGIGMVGVSIWSMKLYGTALFFGTPFLMGLTTAFAFNLRGPRPLGKSVSLAALSIVVTGSVILLFAIEGFLCLVMAMPIALALSSLGAVVGWALARQTGVHPKHAALSMLLMPGLAGAERQVAQPELREVATSVEIDAPPERVWPNVVGFTELPAPPELVFKLGIAYPMRARIHGEGVGAVRHCEFSTGPFVEPITVWDPPRRLAFDVTAQPPSMTELSPYRHVKAAHLEGFMTSKRGEFRLVPLPDGRTRLEGSTWYTLAIFPETYWTVWGEGLLHLIHGRVLRHVKALSEAR